MKRASATPVTHTTYLAYAAAAGAAVDESNKRTGLPADESSSLPSDPQKERKKFAAQRAHLCPVAMRAIRHTLNSPSLSTFFSFAFFLFNRFFFFNVRDEKTT